MNGLENIERAFHAARGAGRAALMPYFTLGFPDPETCLEILQAVAGAGADLIELGVPFSDPLADGPTIQRSTQLALEAGMTAGKCLELVKRLRAAGVAQPLLLMGYYNPILAYGVSRFVTDSAQAGVDGLIVPDLPPEEAGELEAACRAQRQALVYLVAPTTPQERVAEIAARTSGFLYLVSLTGVTGARQALPGDLQAFIERVRPCTRTPLAVGFGISSREQAQSVGAAVDGVIIGSAIIDAVGRSDRPAQAAAEFVRAFKSGLQASLTVEKVEDITLSQ